MGQLSRRKSSRFCAYCGLRPGTTRDHVVPKSLFGNPLPKFMVTVGACVECNQAKSPLDDYLRDYLIADIDSSQSQNAIAIRDGAFLRSIQTNRSVLVREAIPTVELAPMLSPAGLFFGYAPSMKIDGEKIRSALSLIVRGLYFNLRKKRIPDTYQFEISRIDRFAAARVFQEAVRLHPKSHKHIGDGIFDCLFLYAEEDEFITQWYLAFYNSILVSVRTDPPTEVKHLLQQSPKGPSHK